MKKLSRMLFVYTAVACLAMQVFSIPVSAKDEEEENPDVILSYKTHFDIGFTDYASNVVQRYRTDFIDKALKAIDESSDLPEDEQFKWIVPGWPLSKIIEDWSGQTEERQKKVDEAIRNDRILVHALPFSLESESLDLEDMVRSLNYSSTIARKYGKELPKAGKMTDVPEQSWILPTLLKHAGIDFLHIGCNPASTPPDVPPLFWWEGPDGSRVLTMYSKDYGVGVLPPKDWPYDTWLGLKMTGDNQGPPSIQDVENDIAQIKGAGKTYKIGSLDDFAKEILSKDTSKIPVIRGDMPDTWIHGIMAAPEETKISRNIRPQIYQMDSLNSLLNILNASDMNVEGAVKQAYDDSLRFGEHTWGFNEHIEDYEQKFAANKAKGAYDAIEKSWDEKGQLAHNMENTVTPVLKKQMKTLADQVNSKDKRIVVYNALPWKRDGVVDVEYSGVAPASLINMDTKEKIAVDYVKDGTLRFQAKDVPSMGYASYAFSNENVKSTELRVNESSNIMENEAFKITLNPVKGCISSIINKKTGAEMIDQSNAFGFGSYLNERFSNDDVLSYNKAYNTQHGGWAYDDMSKTGLNTDEYKNVPHKDTIADKLEISYEKNNDSITAVMKGAGVENRYDGVELRVTLHSGNEYIDIDWAIDGKVDDPWPMADWLTLPFNVNDPQYRLHRLGGVMDPEKDIVKDTQANNLALDGGMMIVDKSGNGIGLCSKDAPLVSIGKPGIWKFDKGEHPFDAKEPTVFLNLFNNQWDTNYPTWNGGNWSANVRIWAVSRADYEASLITPSSETRNPLVGAYSDAQDGSLPTEKTGVELSAKGVQVTSFGPNIDGDGTVLRLWEQSGKDQKVTVTLPKELKATKVTPLNLRGEQTGRAIKVKNNKFEVEIGKNAPYSVKLDYETKHTAVVDVQDISFTDLEEEGSVEIQWKDPADINYDNVEITSKDSLGKSKTVTVDAKNHQAILKDLIPSEVYTFTIKGKDLGGSLSKGVVKKHRIAGEQLIKVVNAKASNSYSGYDPINLVNRKGITGSGPKTAVHDNDRGAYSMWHTNANPGEGTSVQFDFGEEKAIDSMYIWNMNQVADSSMTDRGFKNVKITYSVDGIQWKELDAPEELTYLDTKDVDYPFQLGKATGEEAMKATNLNTEHKDPVSFGDAVARYVKISAKDSWGAAYWGLSEVMFTESKAKPVQSVKQETVTTVIGMPPAMPETVTATLEDGKTKKVPVDWEEIDPSEYGKLNSFIVKGTVFGSSVEAECKVQVVNRVQPKDKVSDITVATNGSGNTVVSWKAPKDVAFEKVIVKYKNDHQAYTEEVENGNETLTLSNIVSGTDYKVEIYVKDRYGFVSDAEIAYFTAPGAPEANVAATETNNEWGGGVTAINTSNRSGISGGSLKTYVHDNNADAKTMWHTRDNPKDLYVMYDFGHVKKLDEMYIWNMNQSGKTDRGLKNVKILYSQDKETWNELKAPTDIIYAETKDEEYPFQLTQATGQNDMPATNLNTGDNRPVSFDGVAARYVKIMPKDSWGAAYWGLSEVIFTELGGGEIIKAEETAVQTIVNQAPVLPDFVGVQYANDAEGMKAVKWDAVDSALYEKPGEFTVQGTVLDTNVKTSCRVSVRAAAAKVVKTELNTLLDTIVGKVEGAYSPDSWKALMEVFARAEGVFNDPSVNQSIVDEMCKELKNALSQLELVVSPEIVQETLHVAQQALDSADVYRGEEGYEGQVSFVQYRALKECLDSSTLQFEEYQKDHNSSARTELDEHDKQELAAILHPLTAALDEFHASKVHIDFSALQQELEHMQSLNKASYTPQSWMALERAAAEGENILRMPLLVKQSQVNQAVNALKVSRKKLQLKPDLSVLQLLVEEAEQLDLSLYQDKGKDSFHKALKNAKAMLENPGNEQDIKAVTEQLKKAISSLTLLPSRDGLQELIKQSESINKEGYTKDSIENLEAAIAVAKKVLNDKNSTSAQIQAAMEQLQNAMGDLKLISKDQNKPDKVPALPDQPQQSNKDEATNQKDSSASVDTGDQTNAAALAGGILLSLTAAVYVLKKRRQSGKSL